MTNPLQQAIAVHDSALKAMAGVSVDYSDGTYTVAISAIPGRTKFDRDTGEMVVRKTVRDYLIVASDIVLNSVVVLPAERHTITETINGFVHTFEVMSLVSRMDPYQAANEYLTKWRVNTRLINRVAV